ncbi:hypothetical protein [Desulfurobacterium sp.]
MGIAANDWKITAKIKLCSDYGLKSLDAGYWLGKRVRIEFSSGGWIEGDVQKFSTSLNKDYEPAINFEIRVLRADGDFTGIPNFLFRPDDVVKVEPVEKNEV